MKSCAGVAGARGDIGGQRGEFLAVLSEGGFVKHLAQQFLIPRSMLITVANKFAAGGAFRANGPGWFFVLCQILGRPVHP